MNELTHWGVDVGLNSTAICALGGQTPQLVAPRAGEGTLPERLDRLMAETERVAGQLCADYPPIAVCVERPTGRYPSPHLSYATASVLLGLHRALKDRFAYPVSVILVAITEWKKKAIGRGNASKDEVMEWAVSTWPQLDDMTQDDADALGIATYGLASLETAPPAPSLPTQERAR